VKPTRPEAESGEEYPKTLFIGTSSPDADATNVGVFVLEEVLWTKSLASPCPLLKSSRSSLRPRY
jgi:hypothetical protein